MRPVEKKILTAASALGAASIAIGAFGAHGLKQLITANAQHVFQTGVHYQMYHAILLLFIGSTTLISEKSKRCIYGLTLVGVVLFSGSLYALATNALTAFDFTYIGFITPIGGVLLISAWIFTMVTFIKRTPLKDM